MVGDLIDLARDEEPPPLLEDVRPADLLLDGLTLLVTDGTNITIRNLTLAQVGLSFVRNFDSSKTPPGLNLTEFEENTGLELPEGPYETAAGYLMAALGRLPEMPRHVTYAAAHAQGHGIRVHGENDGMPCSPVGVSSRTCPPSASIE